MNVNDNEELSARKADSGPVRVFVRERVLEAEGEATGTDQEAITHRCREQNNSDVVKNRTFLTGLNGVNYCKFLINYDTRLTLAKHGQMNIRCTIIQKTCVILAFYKIRSILRPYMSFLFHSYANSVPRY